MTDAVSFLFTWLVTNCFHTLKVKMERPRILVKRFNTTFPWLVFGFCSPWWLGQHIPHFPNSFLSFLLLLSLIHLPLPSPFPFTLLPLLALSPLSQLNTLVMVPGLIKVADAQSMKELCVSPAQGLGHFKRPLVNHVPRCRLQALPRGAHWVFHHLPRARSIWFSTLLSNLSSVLLGVSIRVI